MNNYIRFMRAYQAKFGIRFLDAVCRARDLYHANKHLSWAEQQAAMDEEEDEDEDEGEDYDAELERQRREQEEARARLAAEREDQARRRAEREEQERDRQRRLDAIRENERLRAERIQLEQAAAERAAAQQQRDLEIRRQREQDDIRRLALAAERQEAEREAMQGADVNVALRPMRPRRERVFTVVFGRDVPAETRAAFQAREGDANYELDAVQDALKDGITLPGISKKDSQTNYFAARGIHLALYPYSILIVSREPSGQFVGFANIHQIQMKRDIPRSQKQKEKEAFEKKGTFPTFNYTGFAIDIIAARGGAAELIKFIYETGERLYGSRFIGLYADAISSAMPFYRKDGWVNAEPLSQRDDLRGRRAAFMESSKELYPRRGSTNDVYDIVDKDPYNIMKPPGLRGGSMEGGANAYTDFMHEWQRVHGGTWACAYMNGIDLYYRSKFMTRADRNRAIREWERN